MRRIVIKSLRLENFKCHRLLVLDLDGRNASIYGDNATGKSSCYDALTWLLFGKDSKGNGEKNMEVKPLNGAGEVADHEAITTVEAVLAVDGVDIALRREYREQWTTKRGSAVPTYDGNVSEYFIDGVPTRRGIFLDRIDEIVSEDVFQMLTNVYFFASELPWQKRREILGRVAQLPEDRQIMDTDARFAALAAGMGKLDDLGAYKAKLQAERKGLMGARNEIPARIDECQKTIKDLEGVDFAGAKAELEDLNFQREQLQKDLLGIEHSNAADTLDMRLREAKLALSTLEAENKAFRQAQEAKQPDTWSIRDKLRRAEADLAGDTARADGLKSSIERYTGKVADCKAQWLRVSGEEVNIDGICPTCGQPLPPEKLVDAIDAAKREREHRLQVIVEQANEYKQYSSDRQQELADTEARIQREREAIGSLKQELEAAERKLVCVADMDGYAVRKEKCDREIQEI